MWPSKAVGRRQTKKKTVKKKIHPRNKKEELAQEVLTKF
jgi:hypothetical protein